jgi:hypothetical protein
MDDSEEKYRGWYAICDHTLGKDREIRVGGEVWCPTSDWSAELTPTEGNTGINPLMLHLDLVVTPPPPDKGGTKVITWVPVEWRAESPAFEYQQVQIRRADADPPPIMDVDHPV